ncbi:MAG: helix-hairpin-helix domain-containing protein [Halopenitus sp.]
MTDASTANDLEPTDLKWIGPATAEAFADAKFSADDVADKTVSYQMLVDAGVNPGVAAKIRREHSLSWSFEAGDGLSERSAQVRGLGSDEAAWVEASSSGDWEAAAEADDSAADEEAAWVAASGEESVDDPTKSPTGSAEPTTPTTDDAAYFSDTAGSGDSEANAEADGSGNPAAAEAAWRERSEPTPVTDLGPVDGEAKALLADAGITSVRSLATAAPEHVADVLDIDQERVTTWHVAARDEQE